MKTHRVETEINGRTLSIETGRLAKQADGAAIVRYGDTVVMGTVVASKEPRENFDFLPLFVEYREMTYAAGKIPGGFFKREGRPTEKETLSARLIDRPLRPLFAGGIRNEIQVIVNVLSADEDNNPDVLGIIAASSALAVSDIPFQGCVGAARVGRVNGEYLAFPTNEQADAGDIDIVLACENDKVLMIEGRMKEVGEADALKALEAGREASSKVCGLIAEIAEKAGKPKRAIKQFLPDEKLQEKVNEMASSRTEEVLNIPDKAQRDDFMKKIFEEVRQKIEEEEASDSQIKDALHSLEEDMVRKKTLSGSRLDGRDKNTVRDISCEPGILPRTHGSAVFTRGETQALAVVTLGTSEDEQRMDGLLGESSKTFMLHYNFPPFSVGEVKPMRGPSRRDIGHGALAEKALRPVLPSNDDFPYTIRIVSEILESNGSSSMATVCGGCLALMDGGVPIKKPVSGIAMGLVKEGDSKIILTDIMGLEDHFGDMDFKAAGTEDGLTAIQMDLKIPGISTSLISDILEQTLDGRLKILSTMKAAMPEPRSSISTYAPQIVTLTINQDKIGSLIGPSGKTIKGIVAKTGAQVNVEDDGTVFVASANREKLDQALEMIEAVTATPEVGKVYDGKVVKIMDFGAFVEILPGQDGLVHISELADYRVKQVEDVVKQGDEIQVKVLAVDSSGKVKLSRKAVLSAPEGGEAGGSS